jgi:anionic cell wall polymer biosynthesis LytR-Cps2A-Psr (LCP) family protein
LDESPEESGTRRRAQSRVPRWARLCTYVGIVLMVLSGGLLITSEMLLARYEGSVGKAELFPDEPGTSKRKTDLKGPLNILLVGIDPRRPEQAPLADAIMILHVSPGLDRAYLFSLPRDLIVDIPSFNDTYRGGTDRLNAAMSHGSRVPGQNPDAARGFQLLAMTISNHTGIKRFDAGAIINFSGFQKIVDAMGGVDLYIERHVKSEHRQPDGRHRQLRPGGGGFVGPQMEYQPGMAHLNGWQALDYVRQRYPKNGVPDGDYGRQRHQQQFLKAMVDQAFSKDVVTNLPKLDKVLRAAGQSVIFNGRGHSVADFGFALRNLRSGSIVMVKLPGGGVGTGSNYRGERLEPVAEEFFAAVVSGTVDSFMLTHPELLNSNR